MVKFFFCLLFAILLFMPAGEASADIASGTLVSAVRNLNQPSYFGVINWTASTSASSTLTVYVRTGTSSDMASAPDWAECDEVTDGADISANNCVTDGHTHLQYRVFFQCDYDATSTYATPELYDISITHSAIGSLVSSYFNTSADDNVISSVGWSENLPSASQIGVQLRTSADGITWGDWTGPASTTDYYTDPAGGETIYSGHGDGTGDQWFQYKVFFSAGNGGEPVLSDLTVSYTAQVPVIGSLSPDYADDNSATTTVTISGSEFDATAVVTFTSWGYTYSPATSSMSDTEIVCALPVPRAFGGYAEVRVTNANGAYAVKPFWIKKQTGSFVSRVADFSRPTVFRSFEWTEQAPASTTIDFKVRSSDSSSMTGAPDWSACSTVASGTNPVFGGCVTDGHRYAQYYAAFSAEYPAAYMATSSFLTLVLNDVNIDYAYYASGTLISSSYNAMNAVNAISRLRWSETVPDGTDIRFQVRIAPDADGSPGGWSAWLGPQGASTYFSNPDDGVAYTDLLHKGNGAQWFQYQAFLDTNGAGTPVLNEIEVEYTSDSGVYILKSNVILNDGIIFR